MKKLSNYLFLFLFSFSAPSFSDDIRDFQIEGISVGDSLLDYFSEEEILQSKVNYYNDDEYIPIYIADSIKFNDYDGLQFHYKKNDRNFTIYAIEGVKFFRDNYQDCLIKIREIDKELRGLLKNTDRFEIDTQKHDYDKTGNSIWEGISYYFSNDDQIGVNCTDWTKEIRFTDNLRVSINKYALQKWINEKAYK